jgi:putative hydrolase of the HAD superfamily
MTRSFRQHVFFDAGNTLVFVNMGLVSEALARRGARATPAELWRSEHRARRALDDPEIIRRTTDHSRWALYFERIFAGCGITRPPVVDGTIAELRERHAKDNIWETVPPEVPLALDQLRRRHRLAVVSNSNGTVREKLRRVGLLPYFDLVIDSHEEGVEKPDPRIFRRAMERTGARPEGSVYVGDFYHIDVAGARAAGMRAVLLDPGGFHADKPVERMPSILGLLRG